MTPIHVAPLRAFLAERPMIWRLGAVLVGSWVIAASSWVTAPMYPVPMTMQTFAVLLVAGMAGARLAFAIIMTWLAQAALGLPFLADGGAGLGPFSGPTSGYLAGFAVASLACGWLTEHARLRVWPAMLLVFLLGHALILACGWMRLALMVGPGAAFDSGIAPFLAGSVLKSGLAVIILKLAEPRMHGMSS